MSAAPLQVTCALIKDPQGRVLVAQRSATMRHPDCWEFPGGKQDAGESLAQCLVREIAEELGLHIRLTGALPPVTHDYAPPLIQLWPFCAEIVGGTLHLREHAQVQWLEPKQLPSLDWAAADVPIVAYYVAQTRPKAKP
jgi:8-oxo-dGTP diphosphatase